MLGKIYILCNHWPTLHSFLDKRRFQSKIANFPTLPVFNAPTEGVALGIGYLRMGQKKTE